MLNRTVSSETIDASQATSEFMVGVSAVTRSLRTPAAPTPQAAARAASQVVKGAVAPTRTPATPIAPARVPCPPGGLSRGPHLITATLRLMTLAPFEDVATTKP